MSYTETEIDLIHKWRPYYPKMIRDAIDRVVLEELKYVKPYIIRDYEKDRDSLLMKAAAELDKKIYKYDDEKQKEVDASMLEQHLRNPTVAYSFMGQAKKDHPDQAQEIEALSLLYIALDIMKSTSEICSDGWLLSVLTYFYGLYQQYPDISDADALIQFIKKEKVIKAPEKIDALPQETRDRLDLNFSENLKPFIKQYALTIAGKDGNSSQITEQKTSADQFKERVAKDSDGIYRWTYDCKERKPDLQLLFRALFKKYLKRIALLFGILYILSMLHLFFIVRISMTGEHPALFLVRTFGGFLVLVLLVSLFVTGVPYLLCKRDYYSYELGKDQKGLDCIKSTVFPKIPISLIKEMTCRPENDMIIIDDNFVLVPSEDYQMVREYILSRLSPKAKIKE